MKRQSMMVLTGLLGVAACLMSGCTTAPTRIQAGGPTAVTTMGVDLQDFKTAAGTFVNEMLRSPAITQFPAQNGGSLPVLSTGSVVNKSDMHIDLAQITGRINEDLLNSGLVELMANDAGARSANAQDAFMSDVKVNKAGDADFYLEGEILLLTARDGSLREKNYTFQLRLNNRARRTVFQKTYDMGKQTTRSNVGW